MSPSGIALVAALAAPVGAYLIAARRFSGKIASTEAAELWAESRSIRQDSFNRIANLNATIERLEARVDSLESENERLRGRISELTNGRSPNA